MPESTKIGLDERTEQLVLKLNDSLRAVQSSMNILSVQIKDLKDEMKEVNKNG